MLNEALSPAEVGPSRNPVPPTQVAPLTLRRRLRLPANLQNHSRIESFELAPFLSAVMWRPSSPSPVTPDLFHTPVRHARILCFTSPPCVPGAHEAPARTPRADPRIGQDSVSPFPFRPPATRFLPALLPARVGGSSRRAQPGFLTDHHSAQK